jgi:hypothetical protein
MELKMSNLFKAFNNNKYAIILMNDPPITNTRLAIGMLYAIGIKV